MSRLLLAFLSGIPALVYQVIWTRQVGLLVGSQVEAVSLVLVAFFAGLALGGGVLGPVADRQRAPLRLYALLEIGAGGVALGGCALFPALADGARSLPAPVLLALSSAALLPCSFLLGGTIPALLASLRPEVADASRAAAWLIAANTAGAVGGVGLAVLGAPLVGLQRTLGGAALAGLALGLGAIALSLRSAARTPQATPRRARIPPGVQVAAALSGAATLAYEVLATRAATLRLGSSLYAWGLVLALFLVGLALAYAVFGARARRSEHPRRDLGALACAAAAALALGLGTLVPPLDAGAVGLTWRSVLAVCASVFPTVFLMGGVLPLLLRLALRERARLATQLGWLSLVNTLGGVAGALLVPFVLLPLFGLRMGLLACAALSAGLGLYFVWAGWERRALAVGLAALALGAPVALALRPVSGLERVLHVAHGRQATAVVVAAGARRELIVDGDPEASTAGAARRTEELLAVLPLALRPEARDFLEIGLGSGITLGAATRFPLERIECVEIAGSVLRAAQLFEPHNRFVLRGDDARIRIVHEDGRAFLARNPGRYDIVVANTLHPWSVGASNLYSLEYFTRVARALRPGGLFVQWLPVERIGAEALAAILRTLAAVFPEGELWWGAESLLVVAGPGAGEPPARLSGEAARALRELGIRSRDELWSRRLGSFAAVREVVPGEPLRDDRPALEVLAAHSRARAPGGELELLRRISAAAAREGERVQATQLWLDARLARAAGDERGADRLEALAELAGVESARRDRVARAIRAASADAAAGRSAPAIAAFRELLAEFPAHRDARFGLAASLHEQGRLGEARRELERLLERHPDDAEAWNLLGMLRQAEGDRTGARAALAEAVRADPYLVEALANSGLLALRAGDADAAREMWRRILALSPFGPGPAGRALRAALAG